MRTSFIALDWGTSSFRAYRVGDDGSLLDTVSAPNGILTIEKGAFDDALEAQPPQAKQFLEEAIQTLDIALTQAPSEKKDQLRRFKSDIQSRLR